MFISQPLHLIQVLRDNVSAVTPNYVVPKNNFWSAARNLDRKQLFTDVRHPKKCHKITQ